MGKKWRDHEDPYSRMARQEREEHLLFWRGCLLGLAISTVLWVFAGWAFMVVWTG